MSNFAYKVGQAMVVKEAGAATEMIGTHVNPLAYLNLPGQLAAAFTPTRTEDEQIDAQDDFWKNLLFKGGYNKWKRLGRSSAESKERTGKSNLVSEVIGPTGSVLGGAGLGALLGAPIGVASQAGGGYSAPNDAEAGAGTGAGVGMMLAAAGIPVGALAAAFTPTRTDEEQDEADRRSGLWNLAPGYGMYNLFKRIGHSNKKYHDLADKRKRQGDTERQKDREHDEHMLRLKHELKSGKGVGERSEEEPAQKAASVFAALL